jgi:hypothetical protein
MLVVTSLGSAFVWYISVLLVLVEYQYETIEFGSLLAGSYCLGQVLNYVILPCLLERILPERVGQVTLFMLLTAVTTLFCVTYLITDTIILLLAFFPILTLISLFQAQIMAVSQIFVCDSI